MKKNLYVFLIFLATANSCTNYQVAVAPTRIYAKSSITKYSCAYILPTNTITAGNMKVSTLHHLSKIDVQGTGLTESVSPSDIIAGFLMKTGYAIVPKPDSTSTRKTLSISYGDCNCKQFNSSYYKTIIIQFRDSYTNELVASSEAEAMGETEASATVNAIKKALKILFKKVDPWSTNKLVENTTKRI